MKGLDFTGDLPGFRESLHCAKLFKRRNYFPGELFFADKTFS
jgi:hypothetical protein